MKMSKIGVMKKCLRFFFFCVQWASHDSFPPFLTMLRNLFKLSCQEFPNEISWPTKNTVGTAALRLFFLSIANNLSSVFSPSLSNFSNLRTSSLKKHFRKNPVIRLTISIFKMAALAEPLRSLFLRCKIVQCHKLGRNVKYLLSSSAVLEKTHKNSGRLEFRHFSHIKKPELQVSKFKVHCSRNIQSLHWTTRGGNLGSWFIAGDNELFFNSYNWWQFFSREMMISCYFPTGGQIGGKISCDSCCSNLHHLIKFWIFASMADFKWVIGNGSEIDIPKLLSDEKEERVMPKSL